MLAAVWAATAARDCGEGGDQTSKTVWQEGLVGQQDGSTTNPLVAGAAGKGALRRRA